MSVAIVVAGGPPPDVSVAASLPDADHVLAADSGADHARTLGLEPTVLAGDLDSISAAGLHWVHSLGAQVVEHPRDKDATDLDLAVSLAAELADEIVLVDSGAGRLDHAAANLALLADQRFADRTMTAHVGGALVSVVRARRELRGRVGDTVTLLAVGGTARGVTTAGLRWSLSDATLEPGSSWGVSNELVQPIATITITGGVLLAIQP